MQQKEVEKLKKMANAIRFLSLDMITKAKSGHPGLPMGTAELSSVLFAKHLRFAAKYPTWENRDKFILSAGHGSALLYSLLHLTGYENISLNEIKNFRQLNSKTAGHPEYNLLNGIETTTGPLGQGLGTAVGIAISDKIKASKLSEKIINNKIYVLTGDGCLMEGISEEAISLAGTLGLNNLIVIWDNNNITIDGTATMTNSVNMQARFRANNWNVLQIKNGYNIKEIDKILTKARKSKKPTFIDVKTIIGKGYPELENKSSVHGSPLTEEQVKQAKILANYPLTPFEIPTQIKNDWEKVGKQYEPQVKDWNKQITHLTKKQREFLSTIQTKKIPNLNNIFTKLKTEFQNTNFAKATRNANGIILEQITPAINNLIGGSADLTGPTFTKNKYTKEINKQNFDGNYISYGIREHEMSACMNGLSLGGFKAYGSTFLTFFDYLKPALRLSALMHQDTIYIFTHDSFFVGEDGPTHQPIEHLASLRAIPNINVIRPADAIETCDAWQIAIQETTKPTILILSRQSTPLLPHRDIKTNYVSKGAYVISDFEKHKENLLTLIASGSEVNIALQVKNLLLSKHNINSKVVSMPSMNLFEDQSDKYKKSVIDRDETITISIEAGSTFGWHKYADINIGLDRFGKSAPAHNLQTDFGFSPEQIVKRIIKEIK